jgi:tRNA(Ile)-lysidine synthase
MDRLSLSVCRNPVLSLCARQIEKSIVSRKLLRDGQKILVAVSGGVDSMVLLHILHDLAVTHRWKLTVAHFNHQLRGSVSEADEQLVLKAAHQLGLKAVSDRGNVSARAQTAGISLEMAGRKLRHDFLARTAKKMRIPTVALAHHADDQVELFFLRLLRGTSGRGLAGMRWTSPSPSDPSIMMVRPFLDQTKEALRAAAEAARVPFSEDASNASLDIHRNRIRHELLPMLRQHYQPRLSERVLSLIELTGAEAEFAQASAKRWLAARRRTKFHLLSVAVQRQIIYLQLLSLKITPDFDLVEQLRVHEGRPVTIGAHQWVLRDAAGSLHERKGEPAGFDLARKEIELTKGHGRIKFNRLLLDWEIFEKLGHDFSPTTHIEYFDADLVGARICLRHWQAGDRFQPIGMKSPRKLQDLFTDLKIPNGQRRQQVVAVTDGGELFWVEGLRMAEKFKLQPQTVRRLKWQWAKFSKL